MVKQRPTYTEQGIPALDFWLLKNIKRIKTENGFFANRTRKILTNPTSQKRLIPMH